MLIGETPRRDFYCLFISVILDALIFTSAGCDSGGGNSPDDGGPDGSTDTNTGTDSKDIHQILLELEGITIHEEKTIGGDTCFLLSIEQPVDHQNSAGQKFNQYFRLRHHDFDSPMVFVTSGYELADENYKAKETDLLDANQMAVEHRYFGDSKPSSLNWSYLNVEQAANDYHRINQLFSAYYQEPWISFGASKGGVAAVAYRRFFPSDVVGTVCNVTPFTHTIIDPRPSEFLDQVGTEECRQRIEDFQTEVLARRAAMESMVQTYGDNNSLTYDRFSVEMALEYSVIEFDFAFWYSKDASDCASIPDSTANDNTVFSYLVGMGSVASMAEEYVVPMEPYAYQAATELGYFEPHWDHLLPQLLYDDSWNISNYGPLGVSMAFDASAMEDVEEWVAQEGDSIMLIYGENDPWTASALDLGDASNSASFTVAGGNHFVYITDLSATEMQTACNLLEQWTGIPVQN